MSDDLRPDPDELLRAFAAERSFKSKGRLRVFLGMSAGVGKTYAMLKAAHKIQDEGKTVLIGLVETHGRAETDELLQNLEVLPRKSIKYRDIEFYEMDIDAILYRKPDLVVIDELPHSNIPGSRHEKRYQDVMEILDAGIDVFTAMNVQHLESRKDSVELITGIQIRETVPDGILDQASLVELIDIAPSELIKRLKEGKVYLGEKAHEAAEKFFKEDKLTALREIALRITAERVDQELQRFSSVKNKKSWQTNERLLVAISHSPYSEKLIRATRRLAYSLEAPWIALHIDTGIKLEDKDQEQLNRNLQLAKELNAEVIMTTDTHLTTAINRISRQKNVTQVIVGRSTRRWFRDLIEGGPLLKSLIVDNNELDIHIIRNERLEQTRPSLWKELSLYRTKSGLLKYWNTLWFLIGITFFSYYFQNYVGYRAIGFVYLLAVLCVGMFGSIGAVLFSAAFSTLAWDYLFINPAFTFTISSFEDVMLCVLYFVVALIVGFLTNRIRFHEIIMREKEKRMDVLYQVSKDVSESLNKEEFIKKINHRVGELLTGTCGVVLKGKKSEIDFSNTKHSFYLNDKDKGVANWSFQNQKEAGWSTDTLSQADAIYLPLKGLVESVGVFIFRPSNSSKKMGLDQKYLLQSISGQLGISIEREFLGKRIAESQRAEDSEKLQQTILSSISHELRTPLTAIISSTMILKKDSGENPINQQMLEDLETNAERLNRVIENLLDMSRLSGGSFALNLSWEDLSDLIGVVIKKHEKFFNRHKVRVDIPDKVPLLRMDFRLFEHALSNLVLNAIQYSPVDTEVFIRVAILGNSVSICVQDNGNGIPKEYVHKIFDKFYRVPGTQAGGTGLGLSIVKNIVELHRGTIRYEDSASKGSIFLIELPLEAQPRYPEEFSV